MHQKIILIGNTGKDVETRSFDNGKVANFPLATSETYKDKNAEKQTTTEWHNVSCWKGLADVAEKYVNKGDLLYIEGKLKTRSWEKDGVKQYRTEVVADVLRMLGGKGKAESKPDPDKSDMNNENDLPF